MISCPEALGQHVQHRCNDERIAAQIGCRRQNIDGDIPLIEIAVIIFDLVHVIHALLDRAGDLHAVHGIKVQNHGDLCVHMRLRQIRFDCLELFCKTLQFAARAGIYMAAMVNHGAVEFFKAAAVFTDLEEQRGICTVAESLERDQLDLARALDRNRLCPACLTRGHLHEHEVLARCVQSAADVVAHGALGRMLVGSRIAVVGNYAGSGADAAVIQRAELEIVRHERVRDIFVDCVAFNFIAFTQGFGEKAQILNRFRRAEMAVEAVDAVHIGREFRCGLGRVDLLPVGIGVTPEGSRPLLIEIVQRAEFLPQVPAIGLCAVVAVADDANLICHVPELDVLIVLIVLGQMLDRGFDLAAVIRAVGAVDLAATGCVMQIIDVRHHDLGVFFAHPVGNSRCSCKCP